MRGPSLVLGLALASGMLLPASFGPAIAAPPSSALADARVFATQDALVKVNGNRRYRRAVAYAGPRHYAPRAYAPPRAYYNPPRAYYPPAPAYHAQLRGPYAAPPAYYAPAASYAAPPAYYSPPQVQVIIIAPGPYPSAAYAPPAYYEPPTPAYYGYYSGGGYYDDPDYDAPYAVRW
jgi:hypothetical protein